MLFAPNTHPMEHTQVNSTVLQTLGLELEFVEYIQYTVGRIADFCWGPYIPSTG